MTEYEIRRKKLYRAEDKYSCSEQDMMILEGRLRTIIPSDNNQADSNGYQITSVYFDDYIDSHLEDSVNGLQFRNKYRIRIYNSSFDTIKLEVKYKRYNRIMKVSKSITYDMMRDLMHGRSILDDSPSSDNPITLFNLAVKQDLLKPSVIVEYDRKAYVYNAGNVRITFDRNVRFSNDFEGFLRNNSCLYYPVNDYDRILEVKYDEMLPGFIGRMLEIGVMNQISYSKYKICRESLEERNVY